jgi:ribosome biogenesis GTPase
LAAKCKYSDCSHADEPGRAVLRAIEEGSLQQAHYQNFSKLRSESEFHDMSYLDKRRKDKAFGRFIKSAKKDPGFTRK